MDKYSSNEPNAAKLLESLRSSGYDNYGAIADLIDNSFDANADLVKVEIGESKEGGHLITIADNGDGMNAKILDQALRLGSLTQTDHESLGKYGMGLITASIAIGRRLVVITKSEGMFHTGVHDLDVITTQNKFIKEIRPSTDTEMNTFLSILGNSVSGTIVLIQNIDNLQNKNLTAFSNTLIKHCGEIFRDFLTANKVITVNRKTIQAVDPMWRNDKETDEFLDKTHEFETENGSKASLRLRIFQLPRLTSSQSKEAGLNIPNQGFYLMRNNRQIARAESLDIFKKHGDLNRFRAELYFNGSLDKKIGVNFKKQNVSLSDNIRAWIEMIAIPQIETIRENAKKEQTKSRPKVDHSASQKNIFSKSSVLKKPRVADFELNKGFKSLRTNDFANVEFDVEHNTHLAPLFRVAVKGDKLTIIYNADHVFYQTVFNNAIENKDLINAIDSLIYSSAIALIGITSTEDRLHLKDEYLDNVSDNLRALLS